MHAGLAGLLNQSVTIYPLSAYGASGAAAYGDGAVTSARVVYRNKKIVDRDGVDVMSSATIYLDSAAVVDAESKIKLPDNSEPRILSVDDYPGPDGSSYYKAVYV